MPQKILAQGAEAIIYKIRDKIVKDRIKKSYRIKEIDEKLRKSRTRSEAKIINKLSSIIPVPKLLGSIPESGRMIHMEFIKGKKLSDNLEKLDYKQISKIIAENISKMHNHGIIHGDLTTSNMIYVDDSDNQLINKSQNSQNLDISNINDILAKQSSKRRLLSKNIQSNENEIANSNGKVFFIDFGLSFHSQKIEDKAVDLHLLQQALEAKHFTIWSECFKIILNTYEKTANPGKEIIQRIKVIESRGRYKEKY
ncbi:MAG: RIO1 family regulatory kinase/ATPase [Nanoarchaeota archaeon]